MTDNVVYGVDFQNPRSHRIRMIERQLAEIKQIARELEQTYGLGFCASIGTDTSPSEMNMDEPA